MAVGQSGSWIRPVSGRLGEAISPVELLYRDGGQAKILDRIEICFQEHRPRGHQVENHLIDSNIKWQQVGRVGWSEAEQLIDTVHGPLWSNDCSTYYGLNDRVPVEAAETLRGSLCLVRPSNLKLVVGREGEEFGESRWRVRAAFELSNQHYNLVVTDPWIERRFRGKADGSYSVQEALVCISLSEAHHDRYAYKLAAAVITPERAAAAP